MISAPLKTRFQANIGRDGLWAELPARSVLIVPRRNLKDVDRLRTVCLLPWRDGAAVAARFPKCAFHAIRDAALGARGSNFPRRLGLFLTDRCNFACPMCAVSDIRREGLARGGELAFEIVERALSECSRHQAVVDLLGGEPLLYSRIRDVLQLVAERRAVAALTTNGLKLEAFAEDVVASRLPILQVSLDGWDDDSQAARGGVRGSLERLQAGVRAVMRAKRARRFPVVRILTAITRNNYDSLDRIHEVVAAMGVRSWGIANYFYLNAPAQRAHLAFALRHGLPGAATAHSIEAETYLAPEQVMELKASLERVRRRNRRCGIRIAYAWDIDLDAYYSPQQASRGLLCELPYSRLDIHTDGGMAVCVSGKRIGTVGAQTIAQAWSGLALSDYRRLYERARPMPLCFRCCGLSQTIRFGN